MALTEQQRQAFNAASGVGNNALSGSNTLFLSVLITIVLLWAAWVLLSTYKGWANKSVRTGEAGAVYVRVGVLIVVLIWFVLS